MSGEREGGTEGKKGYTERIKERERRGSTGSLDDLWKRKREALDKSGGEKIFKRSNKTARSPKQEMEIDVKELSEVIKEMRREFRSMMGELGEDFREQGRRIREEIEELKRDFREQERRWREEREEQKKVNESVKERIKRLEEKFEERGEEKKEEVQRGGVIAEERMRRMERRLERKEKEERRRNIVIKGLEVREGGRREEVEKLLEEIGAKVKALEIKRIGGETVKGREIMLVKLENEEQKWEVIEKKKRLRGRKERISEDLTWEERRTNWRLREIAGREEREGRKVWIKAGRIRIENVWWRWVEEEGVLRDEMGNIRRESGGRGEEGKGVDREGGKRGETGEE